MLLVRSDSITHTIRPRPPIEVVEDDRPSRDLRGRSLHALTGLDIG
jgi:hypothetical protein